MIELENRWWSGSVRASVQFPNTLGDSVISQHPVRQGLQKHLQQKK